MELFVFGLLFVDELLVCSVLLIIIVLERLS